MNLIYRLFFTILMGIFFLSACTRNNGITDPELPENPISWDCSQNDDWCSLSDANNQLGFGLIQQLHAEKPNKNVIISPLSIATALTMAYNGAQGDTKIEMAQTLGIRNFQDGLLNVTYQQLLQELPLLDPSVEAQPANSIWYRNTFPLSADFIKQNTTYFNSQVAPLDFSAPEAKDIINAWVEQQTNGLIPTIVDQITPDHVLFLINAVYFKGAWTHPFDPEKSFSGIFHKSDGEQIQADYMTYGMTYLPYFETETFQAVDIPYGDSIFSMSLLLPKTGVQATDLLPELDLTNWNKWAGTYTYKELFFTMPKFKLAYEAGLKDALSKLGMPSAFIAGQADFSGMGSPNLHIDKVKHKTFMEVNEEGTEAAAVTSVEIVETSVPQVPFVVVDRPFILAIRENKTNSILFLGLILDPTEQ